MAVFSWSNPKYVPISNILFAVVYCVGLILTFFCNFPNVSIFCSIFNTLPSLVDWALEISDDLLGSGNLVPPRTNEPALL
jgi:hypothetical protein